MGVLRDLLQQWEPECGESAGEDQWALIKLRKQAKPSGHSSTDTTARPDQGPAPGTSGEIETVQDPRPFTSSPWSHTQAPPTPYPGSVGHEEHLNSNCVPHILSHTIGVENTEPEVPSSPPGHLALVISPQVLYSRSLVWHVSFPPLLASLIKAWVSGRSKRTQVHRHLEKGFAADCVHNKNHF